MEGLRAGAGQGVKVGMVAQGRAFCLESGVGDAFCGSVVTCLSLRVGQLAQASTVSVVRCLWHQPVRFISVLILSKYLHEWTDCSSS